MTRSEAIDEMLALFKTAWDSTPYAGRVFYDNVSNIDVPPTGRDPWATVSVRHAESAQTTLSGPVGSRQFTRNGVLGVVIYQPAGSGIPGAQDLPTIVQDAFEGVSTPNGVWFRNVRISEVGVDGEWFLTNVFADFQYDQTK